jgi:8-oxo-dGTP pyrophosphatase MutT (NUDIX family)
MDLHRIKNLLQNEHTLPADKWKGAVVFLCTDEKVIFIKRSEFMPTHSGQVAFIGGHKLPHEHDPWIAAQREFSEETNLESTLIEFMGYLPVIMTSRLQAIVQVIAKLKVPVEEFLQRVKSNGEWDAIIAYDWEELCREKDWQYAWRNGYTRSPMLFKTLRPSSLLLWGATAAIVWDVLRRYFSEEKE